MVPFLGTRLCTKFSALLSIFIFVNRIGEAELSLRIFVISFVVSLFIDDNAISNIPILSFTGNRYDYYSVRRWPSNGVSCLTLY